jgi:hypothetical protein
VAIKLIANTIWEASSRVATTLDANFLQVAADLPGTFNIVGGPRHLTWTASDTARKRLMYVQGNGGFSCDTMVLTRADYHSGQQLKLIQWPEPYGTVGAVHTTWNPFTSTLIGPRSQDFVFEFTQLTSKYALGLEFTNTTYTKRAGQFYLGNALTFSNPAAASFRPLTTSIVAGDHTYLIEHEAAFTFTGVSRANIQTLERLYKVQREPVFFYDADGYTIAEKLWHGIITDLVITPFFNDLHTVSIRTARLRHYA